LMISVFVFLFEVAKSNTSWMQSEYCPFRSVLQVPVCFMF
jgi:hypothetical protein